MAELSRPIPMAEYAEGSAAGRGGGGQVGFDRELLPHTHLHTSPRDRTAPSHVLRAFGIL